MTVKKKKEENKKKEQEKKPRKFRFNLFKKEGTVAEPWATAEELLEIFKGKEFQKDIEAIKKRYLHDTKIRKKA